MTTATVTTSSQTSPSAAPTQGWGGSSFATQVAVLTGRSLRSLTDRRMLPMLLIHPLIMLTLFSQVFKGMSYAPGFPAGVEYIDYLMPAIMVTTGTQAAMWAGAGLANELKNGALARFRAMPISMYSLLAARSLFDLVRNALQLSMLVLAALLLFGFRPAGVVAVLGALALSLIVAWGLSWLFIAIAVWVRNLEVMQMVGMVAVFPLMFASNAFAPIESLPGWLQAIATVNPLSYAIDAARGLSLGDFDAGPLGWSLLISALIAVIGAVVAGPGIRKP